MPLRSHNQVLRQVDRMAGRWLASTSKGYRRDIEPLVSGLRHAKSFKGVKQLLKPSLLRKLSTTALAAGLAGGGVQVSLVAIVAATPANMPRVETASIGLLTQDDFKPKSFDAAARLFGKKVPVTSDRFDQLSSEHKGRAFRIATVNNAQLVQKMRNLLDRSIANGETFADWRKRVLVLFDTKGIPRPSFGGLRLAFLQNTLQAYSDARRTTLDQPEIVAAFPFRQYLTKDDRRVRDTHAALDNKIFRAGDSFWDRFTPPWEFGCRCSFIALTAGQVKRSRATVWTFAGGRVRPATRKRKKSDKSFRLAANPNYSGSVLRLNLSGLDDDLRKAIEGKVS